MNILPFQGKNEPHRSCNIGYALSGQGAVQLKLSALGDKMRETKAQNGRYSEQPKASALGRER